MKPIKFSVPMVQAILDGRKSQTRRAIKPQPEYVHSFIWVGNPEFYSIFSGNAPISGKGLSEQGKQILPRYKPGDILWVQETWKCIGLYGDYGYEVKFLDDIKIKFEFADEERAHKWIKYHDKNGWQSPYYMPKEAARIFLRVTNIRVERLQDILLIDCIAKGFAGVACLCPNSRVWGDGINDCEDCMNTGWIERPENEFARYWDSLNAKRGYNWESNPWVWVIEFERIEKPEGVGM